MLIVLHNMLLSVFWILTHEEMIKHYVVPVHFKSRIRTQFFVQSRHTVSSVQLCQSQVCQCSSTASSQGAGKGLMELGKAGSYAEVNGADVATR